MQQSFSWRAVQMPEWTVLVPALEEDPGAVGTDLPRSLLEAIARYRLCIQDWACPCGATARLDLDELDLQHVGLRYRFAHADDCPLNPIILDALMHEHSVAL